MANRFVLKKLIIRLSISLCDRNVKLIMSLLKYRKRPLILGKIIWAEEQAKTVDQFDLYISLCYNNYWFPY